jgi:hypothetical protein
MKTVILAVLLLLAVASIVSGDTTVATVLYGDTPVASIEPGNTTESGKSWYGDEKCLPVIVQTLQLYKVVSLLNCELRHEEMRNAGKTPGVLVLH